MTLLGILLIAILIVWSQREPITRDFVDRALAARGVPARYTITRFGITGQRLEKVVIGDPALPDLTAEWAELDLSYGLGWPSVRSITAGGVRLRGRLINGTVSLGSVDRLLPEPSGRPFALPDLMVDLRDARMRLETPAGTVGMVLEGRGNLADGFRGQLAVVARGLAVAGCSATGATAFVQIAIVDRKPAVEGPVRAARLECPGSALRVERAQVALDATLGADLGTWKGIARIDLAGVVQADRSLDRVRGVIGFDGAGAAARGAVMASSGQVRSAQGLGARTSINGNYAFDAKAGLFDLDGDVQLGGARLAPAILGSVDRIAASADGTPVAPLAHGLAGAIRRAAQDGDVRASLVVSRTPVGSSVRIARLDAGSRSGARLLLTGATGVSWSWPSGGARVDTDIALKGGGFPDARLNVRQTAAGAPLTGEAVIAPYKVGAARLALDRVRFIDAGGMTRFDTMVTLDGPVGDGGVRRLSLPIKGRIGAGGTFAINERCAPLDFASFSVAGLELGSSRLRLCPTGGALLARPASGGIRGGATIAGPRLSGQLGQSPITLAARALNIDAGSPSGFTAQALAVRLGAGEAISRLDIARLTGRIDRSGVGGRFEGATGKIANVPLLLSEGAGSWRLAAGDLTLTSRLRVADAAADPRFEQLVSNDVKLSLVDGIVRATGTLSEPASGVAVTDVTLTHNLAAGRGGAVLDVRGLRFDKSLQPEAVTRLTLGVIANVAGTVSGRGTIDWTPDGVTSGGTFRTDALDLAAAFGPVTGLSGVIRFSDLLGLETAPGQEVTLAAVNPGIGVFGGKVRYQLLPGQKVRIEGGRWPFSGGTLVLEETVLDLGQPVERRLTFRIEGLDAAKFIEQFEFKNIAATGTFDGVLPMIFDATGGRIVGGRMKVRRGGGTLAYVGEVSNADLGTFARLAFDALKSIRYDNLAIELEGALDGEVISRIVFDGVNEQPLGGGEAVGMLKELTGLPFKFNIVVRAPFRGLTNSARAFTNPGALIRGAMPVQPQSSEDKQ